MQTEFTPAYTTNLPPINSKITLEPQPANTQISLVIRIRPTAFLLVPCLLLLAVPIAHANGPELSADKPITFSAATGMLVASGNARFADANVRIEADEIRYTRDRNYLEAEGRVKLTREGVRLLADWIRYDIPSKSFAARNFRTGYPPVFIAGAEFSGTLDSIKLSAIRAYFGEPASNSPIMEAASGRYLAEQLIEAGTVRLRPFGGFGIPLPRIAYNFGQTVAEVDFSAGFARQLGAYLDTSVLIPTHRRFAWGGNLGLFSERGVLIGPALRWHSPSGWQLSIDSGWIRDHNTQRRGLDIRDQPIDRERGFADFNWRLQTDDSRWQAQVATTVVSDSELLRDFRSSDYIAKEQPDSFADFTYQDGLLLINAFARAQVNDYYGMVEKLPELRIDLLPISVLQSPLQLQAFAVATRYRQQALSPTRMPFVQPDNPLGLPAQPILQGAFPAELSASNFFHRLEGGITLARPFFLPWGIDLTLRAGGRWSSYHASASASREWTSFERQVGELGFDLAQTLVRTYAFTRPEWSILRLRHISSTSLQLRWHPGADDHAALIPDFDRLPYSPLPPVIDLAALSHPDGLRDWTLARFGWQHRLLASKHEGDWREWLRFGMIQDVNLRPRADESHWDALYLDFDFRPFAWLRFQWMHKVDTADAVNEASLLRTRISSSDLWSVDFIAEYLVDAFEQYELSGQYRFAQNWSASGRWRFDARSHELNRHEYGLLHRTGNMWQWQFYLSFARNDQRDASLGAGVRLYLLHY